MYMKKTVFAHFLIFWRAAKSCMCPTAPVSALPKHPDNSWVKPSALAKESLHATVDLFFNCFERCPLDGDRVATGVSKRRI